MVSKRSSKFGEMKMGFIALGVGALIFILLLVYMVESATPRETRNSSSVNAGVTTSSTGGTSVTSNLPGATTQSTNAGSTSLTNAQLSLQ